ncbi:MAG: hypothetical protein KVP17_000765 [Porospora cf. gigantea B]|uniref:uncharacterized protein n=1 Tax=Porospora cf. gigantea B TaxID=2853592 RepID=UPI003571E858|nr:MAG: hypothetical protein KVP17_000765 [Porospora cf. gigantea B]
MDKEKGRQPDHKKYRKDKPWDTDDVDKWEVKPFTEEDNPNGLLEESEFVIMFPKYREKYLKEMWPQLEAFMAEFRLEVHLDLAEGTVKVSNTKKTFDPYAIIKGRDLLKLVSRSVPFVQAKKVMEDNTFCDVIRISGYVRNKARFVNRRQRLLGPNGSTLKAIELLTECYVLVQGNTVCVLGTLKGIKLCRRIVVDCMKNVHPVYHVKELMIKRELEKDETLKNENWDRFLPQFRKRVTAKRAKKKIAKKREKAVFPPLPTPRKEDLLMATGEYFLADGGKRGQQILQSEKKKTQGVHKVRKASK